MVQAATSKVSELNQQGVLLEIVYEYNGLESAYDYVLKNITGGVPAFNFFTDKRAGWAYISPTTVVVDIETMEVIDSSIWGTSPAEALSACNAFKSSM